MSVINNNLLLTAATGATTYQVSRSLRFNAGDTPKLTRVFGTPSSTTQWTYSAWIKRVKTSTNGYGDILLATLNPATGTDARLAFLDNDTFYYLDWNGGQLATTSVYRDFSAWLHLVLVYDSANATSTDRLRLYINGTRITSSNGLGSASYPSQNATSVINGARSHTMGAFDTPNPYYMNAYLADVWFLDGVATDASSFGETDSTTGQWSPKAYAGSKPGNSFHLDFSDNSAATAAALGKDSSGNGLNWSPTNFSVTAGAGNDALTDSPTSYGTDTGAGGEVRGNYCTLNPLNNALTLSNGNLDYTNGATNKSAYSTIAVSSGKWYAEVTLTTVGGTATTAVGIARQGGNDSGTFVGGTATSWGYDKDGRLYNNGTFTSYGGSHASGDVIGIALDLDNGTLVFYKNGVSQGTAVSSLSAGAYFIGVSSYNTTGSFNAGQRAFAYTVPSGFKALVDTNLTAPVIAKPSEVMDVLLYTGNGTNGQATTGLNFSPEFVWIKKRSAAAGHGLWDVIRGASNTLSTVNTQTEAVNSVYGKLQSFDSNGFTVTAGTDPSDPRDIVNVNGATYVAWAWDAGTSTVTNTQGSITSSVRANASAGFSIVTYTGTGSNATVGHGLGAGVGMLIIKNRNSANEWVVGHTGITLGSGRLYLNTTDANDTAGASALWNSTAATSSVFSVGTNSKVNSSGGTYVAYVFSPVSGYSAMGSYVGNSSADGPFVYTGFRPRFIMIKNADATTDWVIVDTARETYNVVDDFLRPNSSAAEGTRANLAIDILSNGFKQRGLDNFMNGSNTHIYAAFAESPFQYARAR